MTLPIINAPIYELTIPSTKQKIKFRPFLVKEEKLLLMALETIKQSKNYEESISEISSTVKRIIKSCIQTECDIDKLANFDIEYMFVKLREKSVGEIVEATYIQSPCEHEKEINQCIQKIKVNLTELEVNFPENTENKIMLTEDIGVVMRYPTTDTFIKLTKNNIIGYDFSLKLISSCIEKIFNKDEVFSTANYSEKEVMAFLESLMSDQIEKIAKFFESMPVLKKECKHTCEKCGKELDITLQGLYDFFI